MKKWTNLLMGLLLLVLTVAVPLSLSCGDDDDDGGSGDVTGDDDDDDNNDTTDDDDDVSSDDDDTSDDDDDNQSETVFSPYTQDGKTVLYVNPSRYLGNWYEIATYPIVFQEDCTGSTAEYGYIDDLTISVVNTCRLETLDGELYQVTGSARIVDTVTNAKLRVGFDPFPIRVAPYWIIELDGIETEEPYQWAVVGSITKTFLWILSRTPQMDDDRLTLILNRLTERGYAIEELSFTLQPEN